MTARRPAQIPLLFRCRTPKIPLPCDAGGDAQLYDTQAIVAENREHSAYRFAFFPDGRGIRFRAEPRFRTGPIAAINPPHQQRRRPMR